MVVIGAFELKLLGLKINSWLNIILLSFKFTYQILELWVNLL